MRQKPLSDWCKVSRIAIDTGRIAICDPVNVDKLYSSDSNSVGLFDTGYGDGLYDVFVRRAGSRIAEIKIVFIPHPLFGRIDDWE